MDFPSGIPSLATHIHPEQKLRIHITTHHFGNGARDQTHFLGRVWYTLYQLRHPAAPHLYMWVMGSRRTDILFNPRDDVLRMSPRDGGNILDSNFLRLSR